MSLSKKMYQQQKMTFSIICPCYSQNVCLFVDSGAIDLSKVAARLHNTKIVKPLGASGNSGTAKVP